MEVVALALSGLQPSLTGSDWALFGELMVISFFLVVGKYCTVIKIF